MKTLCLTEFEWRLLRTIFDGAGRRSELLEAMALPVTDAGRDVLCEALAKLKQLSMVTWIPFDVAAYGVRPVNITESGRYYLWEHENGHDV